MVYTYRKYPAGKIGSLQNVDMSRTSPNRTSSNRTCPKTCPRTGRNRTSLKKTYPGTRPCGRIQKRHILGHVHLDMSKRTRPMTGPKSIKIGLV